MPHPRAPSLVADGLPVSLQLVSALLAKANIGSEHSRHHPVVSSACRVSAASPNLPNLLQQLPLEQYLVEVQPSTLSQGVVDI